VFPFRRRKNVIHLHFCVISIFAPLLIYFSLDNKYRVIHGGLLAIWRWEERPICQVKLHTPKKCFFALFLLGRVA
jgi:hypothetical protein